MSTVTNLIIDTPGKGYVNGLAKVVLNLTHGTNDTLANLFVDITVNGSGEVITAVPVGGKTGLDFSVDDLVFIRPYPTTTKLCILKITSVEP